LGALYGCLLNGSFAEILHDGFHISRRMDQIEFPIHRLTSSDLSQSGYIGRYLKMFVDFDVRWKSKISGEFRDGHERTESFVSD
jgi:hypothetical protein